MSDQTNPSSASTVSDVTNPTANAKPAYTGPIYVPGALSVISTERLAQLENGTAKTAELYEKLLRTQADWDNYRKRSLREKEEAVRYANESLLEGLLTIIDNYEAGMMAAQHTTDVKNLAFGFSMVGTQLQNFLKENGVETIDAVGQTFDPHRHEALGHVESLDRPEGTVVQQLRKGYKLKDRLLRAATVMVAKTPESVSVERS